MSESPDQLDYEWHFKLARNEDAGPNPEALTEMVRRQLKALLGCVVLTDEGVDVRATGFRFLADPDAEHAIYTEVVKRDSPVVKSRPSGNRGDVSRQSDSHDDGDETTG